MRGGCWLVPWLPFADGTFRHDRSEQSSAAELQALSQTSSSRAGIREMEAVFFWLSGHVVSVEKMEQLYTTPVQTCFMPGSIPFRDATNDYWRPRRVARRRRNWNRRKPVLLRALEGRGPRRATTRTPPGALPLPDLPRAPVPSTSVGACDASQPTDILYGLGQPIQTEGPVLKRSPPYREKKGKKRAPVAS